MEMLVYSFILWLLFLRHAVFSTATTNSVTLTIRKIEQEIIAAGHHVCILTTKSGSMDKTHMDGTHPNRSVIFLDDARPIPFLHDPHHPEDSYQLGFALSQRVREQIAEFEPSLIHVTVPDCTCLHLIQYARTLEIPLMGTYHSNIPEYLEHYAGLRWLKHIVAAYFRHQYNFLQALYVPTPFIHKHLTDTMRMDAVTKLGVWGRGIDLERFSPKHRSSKFRQSLGFDDNDVVVCWVGRLVPEKRPDIFCDVVRRLAQRNIPFRALVIGAGPCEEEVKALPNTTFAGWMAGDDLAMAYASADIFLFPSAVETFGNVTLEAAASGLPLVVEAGCSGHLVRHGINGFACEHDDLDAFFHSTLCLIMDDERRKSMSREGRIFSMQFEKGAVCRKMLENYTTVTNEFYMEYGGHHANRDSVYMAKKHSFLSGNYTRPIVLRLMEVLFIVLFRVMYQMASAFLYVRESLLTPFGAILPQRIHQDEPPQQKPRRAHINSSSHKPSQPPMTVYQVTQIDDAVLGSITEVSESYSSDSSTHQSKDDNFQEIHIGSMMINDDDDDTQTTASMSEDSLTATAPSCSRRLRCRGWSDCQIDNILSKAFVQCMLFEFRMEGRLRNAVKACFSGVSWKTILRRQRKNSSLAVDDDDEELNLLELKRSRSDGSGDNTNMASSGAMDESSFNLFKTSSPRREERLNMRRPNPVSAAHMLKVV
jgi:phosphatidylinositol alpha 1,6-mannosyltransferase